MLKLPFKSQFFILISASLCCVISPSCSQEKVEEAYEDAPLKEVFKDKFLIGSAINEWQVSGEDSIGANLVKKHYNTVVAENVMKSEVVNPQQNVYDWDKADEFVKFGEDNDMFIVGHCLVWHSQLAKWFPYDDHGNYVSADTLKQRMKDYIYTVVGRYKGRVQGWDVVNEAIEDDGSYRKSPFYEILGEEYIPYAFQLAQEADPDAELYINDYSMFHPGRRDRYVELVNDLKNRGLRIDAIGMQSHIGMDYPNFEAYEDAIEAFASTGCKVMLTETDMTILPTVSHSANVSDKAAYTEAMNPYPVSLPADVDSVWNSRMATVMDICLRHSDVVSRVNFWGVCDADTWRNDWPIVGRKDYPLPFDREHQMKPFLRNLSQKLQIEI